MSLPLSTTQPRIRLVRPVARKEKMCMCIPGMHNIQAPRSGSPCFARWPSKFWPGRERQAQTPETKFAPIWAHTDSNRRHHPCKGRALPAEL